MNVQEIIKQYHLQSYVKDIIVLENPDEEKNNNLSFFADGYPGIVFQNAANGMFLLPENKKFSTLFLYGQTIHPIELSVNGKYKMIVFQLFPFTVKMLTGINPKEINDDCYDLGLLNKSDNENAIEQLLMQNETEEQIKIIALFIDALIKQTLVNPDKKTELAVNLILESNGKISVTELRKELNITERTLERLFIAAIGISPKQFSKIIQFQTSLNQLSEEQYDKISDIVFENGYADQSHFIRNFKKFTGKTPSEFKSKK